MREGERYTDGHAESGELVRVERRASVCERSHLAHYEYSIAGAVSLRSH